MRLWMNELPRLPKRARARSVALGDLVFALENLTDAAARPSGAEPLPLRRARRGPVASGIAALVIAAGGALRVDYSGLL